MRFIWGGKQSKKLSYAIAPVLTLLAIFWGHFAITAFDALSPNTQAVALVQANVSVEDKHQVKSFVTNVTRYKELSASVTRPETLIIWPETVIMEWIFNEITTRDQDRRLPVLGNKSTLLTGALTFDRERQMYNSALLIRADGSLGTPYHKQLLMPFGEYTPFGETFSWLKKLNATAGDFSPGKTSGLIDLVPGQGPKLAPLICYEDVVSDLARRATAQGAKLLINLTNDAWFGDSLAPLQHHQIAAFRALENRRTLLRSTNTGFTAIVDPMGRTTSQLAKFSEGILEADAALLNETSVFVTLAADQIWYWGSLILACVLIGGRAINRVRFSK